MRLYPFTVTFVANSFSFQIIPAIRKLVLSKTPDKSFSPVVISTCSRAQQMCTHYAPLVQGQDFLMGRPTTDSHNASLGEEHFLDWKGFKKGARKVFPFLNNYIDKLP